MNILIESAIKLDAATQKEIESMLSKKYAAADYSYVVNPKVLGGLRVTVGSKRIDLSLEGKLSQIGSTIE